MRSGERDIAAITYGANPEKKGLDRVLAAWRRDRRADEALVGRRAGRATTSPGVRFAGMLARAEYRALLRRARVFVTAPRREDYGIAQLEALADGCMLVTTPSPGPYAALPIAHALDPRLVVDPRWTIRAALDEPSDGYAERATTALAAFSPREVDRVVARDLLLRGHGGWQRASASSPALPPGDSPASSGELRPRARVGDLLARQPRAPGGRDAVADVRERVGPVRVGVDQDHHAGLRRPRARGSRSCRAGRGRS